MILYNIEPIWDLFRFSGDRASSSLVSVEPKVTKEWG